MLSSDFVSAGSQFFLPEITCKFIVNVIHVIVRDINTTFENWEFRILLKICIYIIMCVGGVIYLSGNRRT